MYKIVSLICVAALLMFASTSLGQAVPEVEYQWNQPTTGSFAIMYQIQWNINGGGWVDHCTSTESKYIFVNEMEYGTSYQIRVAGVDSQGRQGGYSLPSEAYKPDLGPPGIVEAPNVSRVIHYIEIPK